jgi:hypothetical protein
VPEKLRYHKYGVRSKRVCLLDARTYGYA